MKKKGNIMEEKIENLQPLKIMELTELHRRQALLDEKFEAKECENERTADALIIAYFDEFGELSHELKSKWNWWKKINPKPFREKVLEEMSDVLHFYLSWLKIEDFWKKGSLEIYDYANQIKDLKHALVTLTRLETEPARKMLGAMLIIANSVGASEQDFLEVHHKKWLKNLNVRTKDDY